MDLMTDTLCSHCGQPGMKHRSSDARCPGSTKEPKWPTTIRDEKRAGEVFDTRLARHWSKRTTTYRPMV